MGNRAKNQKSETQVLFPIKKYVPITRGSKVKQKLLTYKLGWLSRNTLQPGGAHLYPLPIWSYPPPLGADGEIFENSVS